MLTIWGGWGGARIAQYLAVLRPSCSSTLDPWSLIFNPWSLILSHWPRFENYTISCSFKDQLFIHPWSFIPHPWSFLIDPQHKARFENCTISWSFENQLFIHPCPFWFLAMHCRDTTPTNVTSRHFSCDEIFACTHCIRVCQSLWPFRIWWYQTNVWCTLCKVF